MQLIQALSPEQLRRIEVLYEKAFPACERKPFSLILEKQAAGTVDVLSLEDNVGFCGLAITMKYNDLVLLDYFAVAEERRGTGLGSAALLALYAYYPARRFFLEIESTKENAANKRQRLQRKHFYLKNGLSELGIDACVFGTNMELLGHNITLTFDEYFSVYKNIYGLKKAEHVKEL
ncbi:MAG: GNAT family N-acetyltransferase [Lachnospiraceae bacterium]|nr:GNAT family N-acetyltransferase [Lachnospiraceae bacterium]